MERKIFVKQQEEMAIISNMKIIQPVLAYEDHTACFGMF
jgi:hypothetical protein